MAGNQVVVSITGNAKGLQKELSGATGGLSKFGKVAAAVGIAAGAAIVAIGAKSIKSASELQQNMGAMESVFKDNSKQMEAWANKAASSVGLAKSEYAGLATVLGSQLKNMGVATDQLAGQTDGLIRMGADLSAQFGGSTSEAVSALSSLLRGERDPIERYGVSINQAAINAKLAEMGLSGLTGEAAKNANLQATLALLTAQTADSMGAFSREATTLAGSQQRLAAGTENLYATLGTALLPAATAVTAALGAMVNTIAESDVFASFTAGLTSASNAFADFVFNILNGSSNFDFSSILDGLLPALISGIQKAASWLAGGGLIPIVNGFVAGRAALLNAAVQVFSAIAQALPQIIPALVTAVATLIQTLVGMIATTGPALLAAAAQAFMMIVQALVTVLPSILSTLVTLLPQLVQTVLAMIPALLDVATQLFTALVEALPVVIPQLINAVIALLPKLVTTILNMIPKILNSAIKLFTALVESLPVILPLLINAILNLLPKIITTLINMIPKLINAAVQLFTGIVNAIPKVLPKLVSALIGLAPKIVSTLLQMIPQLISAGVNLIGGLVRGLMQAAGSVGNALLNIAKKAVGNFLSFLGIHSPSRLFMGFGKNTVQGLVQGISRNGGLVDTAMDKLSARVSDGFDGTMNVSDIRMAADGHMASRGGNVINYNIQLDTLKPSAEAGRVLLESIKEYERAGGRL
jgi:phage-related protein